MIPQKYYKLKNISRPIKEKFFHIGKISVIKFQEISCKTTINGIKSTYFVKELVCANNPMEKFEIKRTQLSFNGTIEVGSVNIIPIQFVQDIQAISPFIFNINIGMGS